MLIRPITLPSSRQTPGARAGSVPRGVPQLGSGTSDCKPWHKTVHSGCLRLHQACLPDSAAEKGPCRVLLQLRLTSGPPCLSPAIPSGPSATHFTAGRDGNQSRSLTVSAASSAWVSVCDSGNHTTGGTTKRTAVCACEPCSIGNVDSSAQFHRRHSSQRMLPENGGRMETLTARLHHRYHHIDRPALGVTPRAARYPGPSRGVARTGDIELRPTSIKLYPLIRDTASQFGPRTAR